MSSGNRQQVGTAVITALLIVAMVVATTTTVMLRLHLSTTNTRLLINSEQAFLYAQGAEDWAIGVLSTLYHKPHKPEDFITWPKQLPPTKLPTGSIKAKLYDLQNKININNVISPDEVYRVPLQRLLATKIMPESAEDEVDSWLNELGYFIRKHPNQGLLNITELRNWEQLSYQKYQALAPAIIALPTKQTLNINTATPDSLYLLHPEITTQMVNYILETRREIGGFKQLKDFLQETEIQNIGIDGRLIATTSSYFLLRSQVDLDQQRLLLYTLFRIKDGNSKVTVVADSTDSDNNIEPNQINNPPRTVEVVWHSINSPS